MKYVLLILGIILLTGRHVMAAIKEGVDFGGQIKPTTQKIIEACEYVFGRYGIQPTITSAMDGTHMATSKHYTGDALDWRIWESDAAGVTGSILGELQYYLGSDYDVILEKDHIHIEYDPK
jgi:hypothetical protein